MAISSNRSPSPISTRPRTPEAASSIRRSYSGNPFAKNPKSPSDFQGRKFIVKDGVSSRVYEERENEKENCLKQSKIRSPSIGKSSKNFMSPTISAASKINPSPRKKVLGERNEQVRTSMSFSDVRSSSSSVNIADLADDLDTKSETGLNQNNGGAVDSTITDFDENEAVLEVPPVVSKPPKRVTFTGSQVIPDSQNVSDDSTIADFDENEAVLEIPHIVSKPPKRVTFTGSQVIPDSQNVSDSLPVSDFEVSEAIPEVLPEVSKPPKKVTFLGSEVIPDSQIASDSLPDTEPVDIAKSDLNEAVSDILPVSKPPKKVTFEESSIDIEPVGSSIKPPSGASMSPIIAPLDADPSLPPYDPKTNYLSPRPQFLRYRPNPRIEVYLHKEKGLEIGEGKKLEESFLSESLSDTEETGSDESSPKVSEDGSSSAELTAEEMEEESSHVAGLHSSNTDNSVVEVKKELKPKFFTWKKAIGLLVVVLIGCSSLSLTNSPVFEASSYKDLGMSTFYNPSEINEFAEVLVRGFKQMTTSCVSYISRLTQIAEVDKIEPIQFANLTTLLENPFDDGFLKESHIAERPTEEVYVQEEESEIVEETETEGEPFDDGFLKETHIAERPTVHVQEDESEVVEETEAEGEPLEEKLEESEPYVESESIEGEGIEVNEPDSSAQVQNQLQSDEVVANTDFQDQPVTFEAPEEVLEAKPEVISSGEIEHVGDLTSGTKVESNDAERNPKSSSDMDVHGSEVDSSLPNLSDDKPSETYRQVILPLVALALVIIATAIYFKRSQAGASRNEVTVDPLTKKMNPETEERHASQIWGQEVDLAGESCPSEMSSFERTSSYNSSKRGFRATASEAQSQERKQRKVSKRESLASSSSDFSMSPSYGSFTTYEKIPSKHGYSEEEIVTPVRRSSRINKITSP